MTLNKNHWKRRGGLGLGFTLVEMVVVMGIAAMLITTAFFLIDAPEEERQLRLEHAKIEDLVRQGRVLAVSYQQTFYLELSEGSVSLAPTRFGMNEDYFSLTDTTEKETSGLRPLEEMEWPRTEAISPDYELSIRRWGKRDFLSVIEKRKEVVLLEPGGMFEPITVQLIKHKNGSQLSRIYHPLTGLAEDEEMTISLD